MMPNIMAARLVVVFGVNGQDGSYAAEHFVSAGFHVVRHDVDLEEATTPRRRIGSLQCPTPHPLQPIHSTPRRNSLTHTPLTP